jgi:transcriptional regulator with XRE-family HTH domain
MPQRPPLTRLELARLASGFQQQELARWAHMSPGRLSACERGVHEPTEAQRSQLSKLSKLSKLLGYAPEVLFPRQASWSLEQSTVRQWLVSDAKDNRGSAARPSLVSASPVRRRQRVKQ